MHPSPLFRVSGHPPCTPRGGSAALSGGFGVGGGCGHPGSALLRGEGRRLFGAMETRCALPQLGILLPGPDPLGSGRRGLAPLPGRKRGGMRRGDFSGGKTLPAGKRISAGKGHCEKCSPAPEPGSSREPRSVEQRRVRGPKAGGTGLGEREHSTSLLVSVLLTFNSRLFIFI